MILAVLLGAAAPAATPVPQTAIEAERAFAADAHKVGQWTAFKAWSTPDALMFVPQPIKAHDFLKGRKNPPEAVKWSPASSFVSCNGALAVNTGPWTRNGGKSVGYFTTVWKRQPNGRWKWIYDAGDDLTVPRALPRQPRQRRASCHGVKQLAPGAVVRPANNPSSTPRGYGRSADGTLFYSWNVAPSGARSFSAYLWNGKRYERVVDDAVKAPPK